MKRAVFAFLIWAATALPAPAQSRAAEALAAALDAVRAADWVAADAAARQGSDLAADIVLWHRLRAGRAAFASYRDFIARHGDWPGLDLLRKAGEQTIPDGAAPDDVLAYFADTLPQTGLGSLRLAAALERIGAAPIAFEEIRRAWLTLRLGEDEEAAILLRYGARLADQHAARLDLAIWQSRFTEATRMLPLVGDDVRALATTRMALIRGQPGVDKMIASLPEALRDTPGLAFARFKWRLDAGKTADAEDLLIRQSTRPGGLSRPEFWAADRLDLAHAAMRDGRPGRAYLIAATHGLIAGDDFAQLEWLAGYVALTRLDDPSAALGHFRRFRSAVFTPISLGRAGYWEGRALEALGQTEDAHDAYAFGGEYQTAFYGQLAAIRAGLPMDPALAGSESYPDLTATSLGQSSVLAAALLLHEAGDTALFRRFLRHLAESGTPAERGAIGDLALSLGEPHTAIYVAKYAAADGAVTQRPYFPTPDLFPGSLPVPPALALAVARRESEFDAAAISHAGARGLMQLMPRTADAMARNLGLKPATAALTEDPALNIRLGSAYLARLTSEFGGYLPAVAAGYNAGPDRAKGWMKQYGDPRGSAEKAVDWIETIPFSETRNYVMRVLEGYEVYRARLAGGPVEWSLDAVLAGKGG